MNGVIREINTHIRNYDYDIVCGSAEQEYPKEFEIPRENTGTLKDQGEIGACVAEVISQLAESNYSDEMSEGWIYGSFRNDYGTSGMGITTALNKWREIGTVPKTYFDILVEMPEMKHKTDSFENLLELAKKYRLKGYTEIKQGDKRLRDLSVKKALTETQRGLFCIARDYFRESHCIMLTGWNDKNDTYKFKNSWGESFGDKGFGEIPKKEVSYITMPIFEDIKNPFKDVDENAWYYKAVKNVYFSGLMQGTSKDTFEPNKPLTRAEMATLMDRLTCEIDKRFDNLNKVMNEKIKG